MTTRNLVLIVFSLVIFNACSKNNNSDNSPNNPGGNPTNNNSKPLLIDDLVLYTSDGAHRDVKMIKDFVTRNFPEYVNRFYYDQKTVTDHFISTKLEFIDNNKVKLKDTVMEIISKTDTEMLLSPMDSTNMPGKEGELFGHCMLLHNQVPQYNPYSICNKAGGNCKKYRKVYPIKISNGEYYLPILNYAVVSNCNIFYYNSAPMPNYLNKDLTNGLLRDKDSVIVQVARLQVGK
ncbi:hypothetical protein A3860_08315 [Niastella vici]|uniref:Lipoprotein n=1 Tax=Niastella vici TaxID=1703345 RepID=A0A1V9FGY4_9BACT|nr:hypothetical protein [Niastella vici]OQP57625.1 hypothetical protein A3860_08315 [Niastella vici]